MTLQQMILCFRLALSHGKQAQGTSLSLLIEFLLPVHTVDISLAFSDNQNPDLDHWLIQDGDWLPLGIVELTG